MFLLLAAIPWFYKETILSFFDLGPAVIVLGDGFHGVRYFMDKNTFKRSIR